MSYLHYRNFGLEVAKGNVAKHSVVHKFGRNPDIDTTTDPEDIWATGGQIPWMTAVGTIDIQSTSANDTSAGTGARKVEIFGLDSNWDLQTETVTMNGVAAVETANSYIRVYRMFVSEMGTYHGTNDGAITAEWSDSGLTALTVRASVGQTEYASYTIPNGYTGYMTQANFYVSGLKEAIVRGYKMPNANDVTTAFTGAERLFLTVDGLQGVVHYSFEVPQKFGAHSDIWWTAEVSAINTEVAVDFEIILVED